MHCVKDAVEETKTLIRHSASAAIGCSGTVRMAKRLNTMKDPVPWLIIMFPIITIILFFSHFETGCLSRCRIFPFHGNRFGSMWPLQFWLVYGSTAMHRVGGTLAFCCRDQCLSIPIRDVISSRMPLEKKENWSTRTRTNSTYEKLTRWRLCLQQKLMRRSATKPVFTCLFLASPSLFTGGVVPRIISSLIWNFDWPE